MSMSGGSASMFCCWCFEHLGILERRPVDFVHHDFGELFVVDLEVTIEAQKLVMGLFRLGCNGAQHNHSPLFARLADSGGAHVHLEQAVAGRPEMDDLLPVGHLEAHDLDESRRILDILESAAHGHVVVFDQRVREQVGNVVRADRACVQVRRMGEVEHVLRDEHRARARVDHHAVTGPRPVRLNRILRRDRVQVSGGGIARPNPEKPVAVDEWESPRMRRILDVILTRDMSAGAVGPEAHAMIGALHVIADEPSERERCAPMRASVVYRNRSPVLCAIHQHRNVENPPRERAVRDFVAPRRNVPIVLQKHRAILLLEIFQELLGGPPSVAENVLAASRGVGRCASGTRSYFERIISPRLEAGVSAKAEPATAHPIITRPSAIDFMSPTPMVQ